MGEQTHEHNFAMTSSAPIDFDAMLASERRAAASSPNEPLKACSCSDVYNGLQRQPGEGARLMTFDVRTASEYSRCRIRDAECLGVGPDGEIRIRGSSGEPMEFKVKGDIIAVVYDEASQREGGGSERMRQAAAGLKAGGATKVVMLDGGFRKFSSEHRYLCLGDDTVPKESLAYCTWPREIVPRKLYLGTIKQASNASLRGPLGITRVINLDETSLDLNGDDIQHWPTANEPTQRIPI